MLVKFNLSVPGYSNNNIGNNKNMQGQPVFGAQIGIKDVVKRARQIEATKSDSKAQTLLDSLTVDVRDTAKQIGRNFMSAIKTEAGKLKKLGKSEDADVVDLLETLSQTRV